MKSFQLTKISQYIPNIYMIMISLLILIIKLSRQFLYISQKQIQVEITFERILRNSFALIAPELSIAQNERGLSVLTR